MTTMLLIAPAIVHYNSMCYPPVLHVFQYNAF
jgi:hypothetical protein